MEIHGNRIWKDLSSFFTDICKHDINTENKHISKYI